MSNTTIQLRHSTETGNVPVSLANGEIAVNSQDGKLFYADPTGTVQEFSLYPGPSGLDTEVQFNDSGVLGSSANLSFNKTTNVLSTKNIIVSGNSYFGNANLHEGITQLSVTNDGASAYLFDQYAGSNPSLYVGAGQTISFNLNVVGHPFVIRESSGGANTSDGLTHISNTGVVTTGADAQGKVSGVLFWKVPFSLVGSTYVYQCTIHGGMVGDIVIQQPASFVAANTTLAFNTANAAFLAANAATATDTTQNNSIAAAFIHANAAFDAANTGGGSSEDQYARDTANAAFDNSNTKFNSSGGTISGNVFITGGLFPSVNNTGSIGNSTFTWNDGQFTDLTVNNILNVRTAIDLADGDKLRFGTNDDWQIYHDGTANRMDLFTRDLTIRDDNTTKFTFERLTGNFTANGNVTATNFLVGSLNVNEHTQSAFDTANSASVYANGAFARANNSLNANTGGEVSANLTISANLTASNVATQTYIQFGDGTKQFTASTDTDQYARDTANASFIHANSSFDFANTISGGSAIDNVARALANSASSTNITQNNSIAAAFIHANSAFDAANTGGGGITVTVDTIPPASGNTIGDIWIDTDTGKEFRWIDDGDSYQWVEFSSSLKGDTGATGPTGQTFFANAAFDHANSSFDAANTNSFSITSAFIKANSATVSALSSFNHANAAFDSSNTKFSSTGGTITGDLIVSGNLTITGNTVTHSANDFIVNDPIILLANNNPGNLLDIGFVAHYEDGGANTKHTGLIRDVSSNVWYLFENYEPHIQDEGNLLDLTESFTISTIRANISTPHLSIIGSTESAGYFAEKSNIIGTGLNTTNIYQLSDGVVHYHTANSLANATVSLSGFSDIGVGNSVAMAVLITNNTNPKYISTVQVDGTATGVTVLWSGGSAPTGGNSSNTDIYSFSIIKTAATPTYTVFASQTQFGG